MADLSAYVSLYDDASLLGPSLAAVAPLVDEIVVVDGAYRWMTPFLDGRDPSRSGPRVDAVLAPFQDKLRVVRGTWENEIEKRAAGFDACRGRYVLRLDADEVLLPDRRALRRFRDGPHGAAWVPAPTLASPDWMQTLSGQPPPRHTILFDRQRVDAAAHLAHVWLVLPDDERQRLPPADPALVARDPFGFLAHLTMWRLPEDAANRARFYILNYVRSTNRLPFVPEFDLRRHGFASLARTLGVPQLSDHFRNHPVVTGALDMAGQALQPVPSDVPREELSRLHAAFLSELAAMNRRLQAHGRFFAQGEPISLDATGSDALPALTPEGKMRIELSHPLSAARIRVHWLLAAPPWSIDADGRADGGGTAVRFTLPATPPGPILRRILTLQIWLSGAGAFGRFRPIA